MLTEAADERLAAAFDFDLPAALIAQEPARPRDSSRLLSVRGGHIHHGRFIDFPDHLRSGDVLVINDTRVMPVRVDAGRPTGGRVQVTFLRPAETFKFDGAATRWLTLVKPAKRLRIGDRIGFGEHGDAVIAAEHHDGVRELELHLRESFEAFLKERGRPALPPYIHKDSPQARAGYQTIFAREPGSVAAPTASLHFTPDIFAKLRLRGVTIAPLCLDVGLGTFLPMRSENLENHRMHAERYSIPESTVLAIEAARRQGARIVAAGTTVVRALEGSATGEGRVSAGERITDLFIRPGFEFRVVDALLTNFHLPRSTLLVLVCAFAGRAAVFDAYAQAIERGYRFYSFGDAMFIEARRH